MVSKIIQLEKERADKLVSWRNKCKEGIGSYYIGYQSRESISCEHGMETANRDIKEHKRLLINLKKYMEENIDAIEAYIPDDSCYWNNENNETDLRNQLKEDIQELTKMIARYE